MSRLLIVEDEAHLAEGLRFNLEADSHSVEIVRDGESALKQILEKSEPYDAVILDVMLPGINGFAVVSALRKAKNYVPVLILTARGRSEDVLQGFASGADDYLPKPFQLPIFLARLQGLLRRSEWLRRTHDKSVGTAVSARERKTSDADADSEVFSFNGMKIDFAALELRASGTVIQLTLMEAKLLRHLIRHRGRTVSRKSILEEVWDLREDTDTRAIDNFIVRLRRYLEEDPSNPKHLLTVRGVGYRFVG
jgi:DNA-binding response OmpR family regulator